MSESVTPFAFCDFDCAEDMEDYRDVAPFQTIFGGEETGILVPETPSEPERDLEAEARKIFEDAYVQGERAGREMGMKKTEPLIKRLNSYISNIEAFRGELLGRTEQLSVELALVFAETIVRKECDLYRETVVAMAKRALEFYEERGSIVIRVRPDDAGHIDAENSGHVRFIADDSLKEPGFLIETDYGDIDGRLSTQLDELRKEFLNESDH